MTRSLLVGFTTGILLSVLVSVSPSWAKEQSHWVTTWAASPDQTGPAFPAATIRQIIRTSIGGSSVRIRLSNLYGTEPVTIGAAHLALHTSGSAIAPESDRGLTFNGSSNLTIAKGASALSDPVSMPLQALQELAISLYLPTQKGLSTMHGVGMESAYIQLGVDASAAASLPSAKITHGRYFLTDVEVAGDDKARAIVVVGDSIVDGVGSGVDAHNRWVDDLATRLHTGPTLAPVAVVNSGIAGNRLLQTGIDPFRGESGLARFDRDALDKPGVQWVILNEGGNDIGAATVLGTVAAQVSAQQIITGMKALIARAHAKGINIIGATLTPCADTDLETPRPYYSAAGEIKRQEINAWIRKSHAFDGLIDFDLILRDPAHREHILATYDSGDHLHPNEAGHQAMADAINLSLFRVGGGKSPGQKRAN